MFQQKSTANNFFCFPHMRLILGKKNSLGDYYKLQVKYHILIILIIGSSNISRETIQCGRFKKTTSTTNKLKNMLDMNFMIELVE